MKKYILQTVKQNGYEFYVLVADPRIIVKLLVQHDAGAIQETQRPWNESRVKEIAKYVVGKFVDDESKKAKGLIPNAPILNIKSKIEIKADDKGLNYIELPSTEAEIANYAETIEAIDGQHRIRAFMNTYMDPDFKADNYYVMVFTIFYQLSTDDKKELFMITNEKQEKVPTNLLRLFKRDLGLLKGDEEVYDLVESLNTQDYSPLKGRIKIGAERIRNGYQESQISKILNKSETFLKLKAAANNDREKMSKVLSNYLKGWEAVYSINFSDPHGETFNKISGLRYMLYIFPNIFGIVQKNKKTATKEEFTKLIRMIPDSGAQDPFGTCLNDADKAALSLHFRNESGTVAFAKEAGAKLESYEGKTNNNFDVTEGI